MTQEGSPGQERSPSHDRRWAEDDDLLAGLDRAGRPKGLRAFFATTLGAALLAWSLAFSLSAYHTVFYWRLLQIFVVAAVLLLGAIVLGRSRRIQTWTKALLASPIAVDVFTTCQDYVVAGDNQPENCHHSSGYRPNHR